MWTPIPAITNTIVSLLILQFDGSLRSPSTLRPNEDVRPHHIRSPSSPMASCAAVLLKDDGRTIQSLGGKPLLSVDLTITSADAEYEGLLLGLKHLLYLCENQSLPSDRMESYSDDVSSAMNAGNFTTVVLIQGDCKMIIDHLNQRAIPRKQRRYYDESKELMDRIQSVTSVTEKRRINFQFQHIPRNENKLTDFLCQIAIAVLQKKAVEDLQQMTKDASEFNNGDNPQPVKLPTSKKKRLIFSETPFSTPLTHLSNEIGSYIPLYARPALVCNLACAAIETDDPVALRLCGQMIVREAKSWKRLFTRPTDVISSSNLDDLGRSLECIALVRMGLCREAEKIGKKGLLDGGVNTIDCADESSPQCVQVINELCRIQSLVNITEYTCINCGETVLPHSDWNSVVDSWCRLLIDSFVAPEIDVSQENGWKKLLLKNSVWLQKV